MDEPRRDAVLGWGQTGRRGARRLVAQSEGVTIEVLRKVVRSWPSSPTRARSSATSKGEADDWGYANRPVRGSKAVSDHASATAVDIDATCHGLGTEGTFSPAQVDEIHRILGEVAGMVRWGGDYSGRSDCPTARRASEGHARRAVRTTSPSSPAPPLPCAGRCAEVSRAC